MFMNARIVTDRLRQLATDDVSVIVFDASGVSSIDSTGFDGLLTLRDELAAKDVEKWAINPPSRRTALLDQEAAVLGVVLPRRFQSHDEVLEAFNDRSLPHG